MGGVQCDRRLLGAGRDANDGDAGGCPDEVEGAVVDGDIPVLRHFEFGACAQGGSGDESMIDRWHDYSSLALA